MNELGPVAVQVEGLGKRYRIGAAEERPGTLRELLTRVGSAPVRKLRELKRLRRFADQDTEDIIWALRDVSFDVRHGEALGIVGRNGAGKSTLLKLLSRITKPTEGRAVVDGRVGSLLEVGTGFHLELTGRENVYLNGSILGMGRSYIDEKFDEIVEFAGVARFIDTPVKRYSSGMKVRLAFAVAAHLEPDILIIDEVLAVGDAEFQRKCLGKMDQVAGEGRTVLFVSHDMDAITRLCERAILLDEGRMVGDGPAPEIVHTYLNGATGLQSSAEWTGAEGAGRGVELRAVRLTRADGSLAATGTVEEDLELEIVYAVEEQGLEFRCSAGFFTQGMCAFTTVEPNEERRPKAGVYRSSVTIPGHLLAEGHYSVNVSVFATRGSKVRHAFKQNILAFQIVDPMLGTSARGDYGGNINGLVRPRLDWHLTEAAREMATGTA